MYPRYLSLYLSLNSRRTVQDLFRRNSQLFPTPPTILTPRPSNALLNEGQDTEGRRGIRIDHTGELLSSTTFIHRLGDEHECGERVAREKADDLNRIGNPPRCDSPSTPTHLPRPFCVPTVRSESPEQHALSFTPSPTDYTLDAPKFPWSTSPVSHVRSPISGHSVHTSYPSLQQHSAADIPSVHMYSSSTKKTGSQAGESIPSRASPKVGRISHSSRSTRSKKSSKSSRSIPQIGSLKFPSEIRLTLESRASSSASLLTTGSSSARSGGPEFF